MAIKHRIPLDYDSLDKIIPRGRNSVLLRPNTILEVESHPRVSRHARFYLSLHGHTIITFKHDRIVLDSCGFRTVTTKDRLNTFLPKNFLVFQVAHQWYLLTPKGQYKYYDGMEVDYQGNLVGEIPSGAVVSINK